MCPPSFIEIASIEEWNLTQFNYYYCHNNNSEDETTQKQDPIPLAGEWDNESLLKVDIPWHKWVQQLVGELRHGVYPPW